MTMDVNGVEVEEVEEEVGNVEEHSSVEVVSEAPAPAGKQVVTEPKLDDRPEKNLKAEMNRKLADRDVIINQLKSKMTEMEKREMEKQNAAEIKALESEFEEMGLHEKLPALLDRQISAQVEKRIKEFDAKKQVYSSAKKMYLAEIQASDESGLVAENLTDIEAVINEFDPEVWNSRDSMKNAVGLVLGNILLQKPKAKAKVVVEPVVISELPTVDGRMPAAAKGAAGAGAKKSTISLYQKQIMGIDDESARGIARASDSLDSTLFGKKVKN